MSRNLWQTVLRQIFLFLSFVSNIGHLFLNLFENFKTGVDYKKTYL